MRVFVVVALLACFALAGCAQPEATTSPSPPAPTAPPGSVRGVCVDSQIRPVNAAPNGTCPKAKAAAPKAVPMDWSSKLGTSAIACAGAPVNQCTPPANVVPEGKDWIIDGLVGNITAADVQLTWTSGNPTTDTLGFGLMVMGQCKECKSTTIETKEGTSPLRISKEGLNIAIGPGYVLHAYAWNPKTFAHNPPVVLAASIEQAFRGTGNVTLMSKG